MRNKLRVTNSFVVRPIVNKGYHHNILSGRSITNHRKITIKSSTDATTINGMEKQKKLIKSMLYRINECNYCPPNIQLYDFIVDDEKLGKVTIQISNILTSSNISPPIFTLTAQGQNKVLTLTSHAGSTYESRTNSIQKVMEYLKSQNIIQGWRNENYPVCSNFYSKPKFLIERAAAPLLGIQQYGVHINGLVVNTNDGTTSNPYKNKNDTIKMWIGRRSKTKSKYPNMLDHIVAGGQPHGISLLDNVIKECEEEAGIPEDIVRNHCYSVGCVNYQTLDTISIPSQSGAISDTDETSLHVVSRSVLFCYDIYLPNDFIPKIVDGEVQDFFTWDLEHVAASLDEEYHDPIKPNCYLVIIDFLIRMGYITPDVEGYLDVLRGLRNDECL